MMAKKSVYILPLVIIAMALTAVSCERSYAEAEGGNESQATPTVFSATMPADGMNDVLDIGAQTAAAETIVSGAPTLISTAPPTVGTGMPANPTAVPITPTEPPALGKPSSYQLEQGEFPYCLARRFNVDPSELLNLNGMSDVQARMLQPGLVLSIPQGGKTFPSPRALNPHPDSYTLPHTMSVYAVACYYGDVEPSTIINANTISDINNIPAGTVLTIP